MTQLNLFDVLRRPAIVERVDPDGHVVKSPDEEMVLPHPRLAWPRAVIQLHKHDTGLWMWGTGFHSHNHGMGYRVGAKWGKFAESRSDALFYACQEIRSGIKEDSSKDAAEIRQWLAKIEGGDHGS